MSGYGYRYGGYYSGYGQGYNVSPQYNYGGSCCPPATCGDVYNVDRDLLKDGSKTRDRICESTHWIEKDIWDTDKHLSDQDCKIIKLEGDIEKLILKEHGKTRELIREMDDRRRDDKIEDQRMELLEAKLCCHPYPNTIIKG